MEKYLAFDPQTRTKFQIKGQRKLNAPWRENRKIQNENKILKTNEHAS
jgi:hypothetical protein